MQNNKTIKTSLLSTPAISVPNNFTALHMATIAYNLYCHTAPTHYTNEFSIHEGSDFVAYSIEDSKDISEHFYDCAFAIGNSVQQDVNYSVQDAYNLCDDFYGDTCVREEASSMLLEEVKSYIASDSYAKQTDFVVEDYAWVCEDLNTQLPTQIANLEKQLAQLKATQDSIQ